MMASLKLFACQQSFVSFPSQVLPNRLIKENASLPSRAVSSSFEAVATSNTAALKMVPIMVNDCTGKMGRAVAEAAVQAGLELVPFCLTRPGAGGHVYNIKHVQVNVYDTSEKESVLDKVLERYPDVIIADYTLPSTVNDNAEFYCRRALPFVMGTTGGDRTRLLECVHDSGVYAVIAPQMGKQVVAFQATMEIMAEQFPGAFSGYELEVTESHQSTKADTSGTARAVVGSFRKLGINFTDDKIRMIRNPEEQISLVGVPKEDLEGHAYHTYKLRSPDGMVEFQFQHNVRGRSIYAQGTVDAVLFLAKQIKQRANQKLYNMVDVLRGGNMR